MSNLGKNILKEAEEIINGPRRESYGSADKSFQLIADLWSSYLDFPITKRDVANLMILLKVARDQNRPKHDNQLDIIGYAALADGFEKEERLTGPCHSGHAWTADRRKANTDQYGQQLTKQSITWVEWDGDVEHLPKIEGTPILVKFLKYNAVNSGVLKFDFSDDDDEVLIGARIIYPESGGYDPIEKGDQFAVVNE